VPASSSSLASAEVGRFEQRSLRLVLAAVVALQLAVGLGAAVVVSPPKAVAAAPPATQVVAAPPAPSAAVPGETEAADAIVPSVPLFEQAGAAQPFKALSNPTWEGVPLVFHVFADTGPWLHVRVNIRPNGTTAWIRRSDVSVRRIANRVVVELGEKRLTVLHGNDVLAQHRVAIGAPSGPTPVGEFYIDATVRIRNPNGPYGIGQLSVSGFSDVYHSFDGGIGQIAIHGTNNPSAIGGTVSHGCVRMLNEDWVQVAMLSPNGTPVSIRA
jgi:lipoprotein-anchoring transpeptidase ErfK/SrfK